jgi:hypothetical protein
VELPQVMVVLVKRFLYEQALILHMLVVVAEVHKILDMVLVVLEAEVLVQQQLFEQQMEQLTQVAEVELQVITEPRIRKWVVMVVQE